MLNFLFIAAAPFGSVKLGLNAFVQEIEFNSSKIGFPVQVRHAGHKKSTLVRAARACVFGFRAKRDT
jgi:hypothetical protein